MCNADGTAAEIQMTEGVGGISNHTETCFNMNWLKNKIKTSLPMRAKARHETKVPTKYRNEEPHIFMNWAKAKQRVKLDENKSSWHCNLTSD